MGEGRNLQEKAPSKRALGRKKMMQRTCGRIWQLGRHILFKCMELLASPPPSTPHASPTATGRRSAGSGHPVQAYPDHLPRRPHPTSYPLKSIIIGSLRIPAARAAINRRRVSFAPTPPRPVNHQRHVRHNSPPPSLRTATGSRAAAARSGALKPRDRPVGDHPY
jgi:hypothetical protein